MDIVIPIVFPDYLITVATPEVGVAVPDMLPWTDILPNRITVVHKNTRKYPELGHAGVLFINGQTGTTKYYEYGRYDPQGKVMRRSISDVVIGKDGHPTQDSLKVTLYQVSKLAGQNGRIRGAYIEVNGKYQAMLDYAELRSRRNHDPKRPSYELLTNNCMHFAKDVVGAAGISLPLMFDPRPILYIEKVRTEFPALDYLPRTNTLIIHDNALD